MPNGHTIAGTINTTVTLGVGVYLSPLTIAAGGVVSVNSDIWNYYQNLVGVYVPAGAAGAQVVNDGVIAGGHGGFQRSGTGYGVEMAAAAALRNAATILGGFGGSYRGGGYAGGTAVFAHGGRVATTGLVQGGGGGAGYYAAVDGGQYSGGGGTGGAGVVLNDGASLSNEGGKILGGLGGANTDNAHYPDAGGGGAGVVLSGGFALTRGTIGGGAGGYEMGAGKAGNGGDGVDIFSASTLYNYGSVTGGGGGGIGGATAGVAGQGGAGVSMLGAGAYLYNTREVVGGAGGGFANAGEGQGGHGTAGVAGAGLSMLSGAYVYNTGNIIGGAGASALIGGSSPVSQAGGAGGAGVAATGASGSNAGLIRGGSGGYAYGYVNGFGHAEHGGMGLDLDKGGFTNTGRIEGGAGGTAVYVVSSALQGVGGIGVGLRHASMSSTGYIAGGYGGGAGVTLSGRSRLTNSGTVVGGHGTYGEYSYGYAGGVGVAVYGGSRLVNTGLITGGSPGGGLDAIGGAGIFINGGLVVDSGTVLGGHIGDGHGFHGYVDYAVQFGRLAGTLELKPGASFGGNFGSVVANAAVRDVLEFSGRSPTILSGIGTEITGFNVISFAAGARWAIKGNVTGLAGGQTITGFAVGDKIILDDAAAANGTATVSQAGVVAIEAGGEMYSLDILGATVGEAFSFSDYALTETPARMAFLAPAAGMSVALAAVTVSDAGFIHGQAAPVGGLTAAMAGGMFEPVTVGMSGAPVVTLQS